MPSGVASPACSAIVQLFLRGRSDSSPPTNNLAWSTSCCAARGDLTHVDWAILAPLLPGSRSGAADIRSQGDKDIRACPNVLVTPEAAT